MGLYVAAATTSPGSYLSGDIGPKVISGGSTNCGIGDCGARALTTLRGGVSLLTAGARWMDEDLLRHGAGCDGMSEIGVRRLEGDRWLEVDRRLDGDIVGGGVAFFGVSDRRLEGNRRLGGDLASGGVAFFAVGDRRLGRDRWLEGADRRMECER
ncbi:MAG: hypothetical protein ABW185_28190 [Sedimenticola sp.]